MSNEQLQAVCDDCGLDLEKVVGLLEKSQVVKSQTEWKEVTPVNPDQVFLERLRQRIGNLRIREDKIDLSTLPREDIDEETLESEAYELLDRKDNVNSDEENAWSKRRELSDKIENLFFKIFLQKGLKVYDQLIAQKVPEIAAQRDTFDLLCKAYRSNDNIAERQRALRKAIAKFGLNLDSIAEANAHLSHILEKILNRTATEDERIHVDRLMKAVKGVALTNSTSVNAGMFAVLVPTISGDYKTWHPRNSLSAGSRLGGEVYDVGVYAGQNFPKGGRPRRSNDSLEPF